MGCFFEFFKLGFCLCCFGFAGGLRVFLSFSGSSLGGDGLGLGRADRLWAGQGAGEGGKGRVEGSVFILQECSRLPPLYRQARY